MDIKDRKQIFCPYCGQKFLIDDGKIEYTIKKNIYINKTITNTNKNIDDAEIIKALTEVKEKRNGWIAMILCCVFIIVCFGLLFYMDYIEKEEIQQAVEAGKISAGYYGDYTEQNYEAVVKQLKILGFHNISTIDLDDAGFMIWKCNKVESVSIGGNASFQTDDYFYKDENVIITYH